jgi:hypothetical protein
MNLKSKTLELGIRLTILPRLCIPSEFRRIPTELGKKAPAGTECESSKHRNAQKRYLSHSSPFRLVLVYRLGVARPFLMLKALFLTLP